jgi:hypothetical protein
MRSFNAFASRRAPPESPEEVKDRKASSDFFKMHISSSQFVPAILFAPKNRFPAKLEMLAHRELQVVFP